MFKIHCSAIGKIMAKVVKIDVADFEAATKKAIELAEIANEKGTETAKKRAAAAFIAAQALEAKMHKQPLIPQGAKTFVEHWQKAIDYDKDPNFNVSSKYTQKGVFMEGEAIAYLNENTKLPYMEKNTEQLENEFFVGTPDVRLPSVSTVIDVKCSWDCFTFPKYETELESDYEWQVFGYMDLLGFKKAQVIYVLMNAPDFVIEKEAYKLAAKEQSELTEEIYERTKAQLTYDHFPPDMRIKIFTVEYCPERIEKIKQRVLDCRAYLSTLI